MREQQDEAGLSLGQARRLIEAIRKIKSQKQRPSLERISHALGLGTDAVEHQLEQAIAKGFVLKVMNKGQCTYKDAETLKLTIKKKCATTSSVSSAAGSAPGRARAAAVAAAAAIGAGIHRRTDLMHSAVEAVRALGEKGGSTFRAIVKFVRQALRLDPGVRLRLAVKRAVTAGRLVRVGRLYRLPGSESDESETDSDDELDASDRLGVGKNGDITGRTGHKRKSALQGRCSVCHGSSRNNRNGVAEELISCHSCTLSAHPSCLKHNKELALVLLSSRKWQCSQCRMCSRCGNKKEGEHLLCCEVCDSHFHLRCLKPPLAQGTERVLEVYILLKQEAEEHQLCK
ncbi:hypothetical protein MTO96_001142 [Rhipicephalus appendiculatus]